ncbi:two-component response regulator ORR41-like [Ananas comosus]|uniref:Two-component response regulator ORR41-like n=2 Tax=Ananas comosus TaxID=4615 RepID=A0A6P5H2X3_ANACO|nr:two-component response regulator ORR41-like [Ananas comosus]
MALGGARFRYIISSNTLGRFGLAMGEGAKRILLVEDTEVNRVVVRRLVRELNVSLEEAENGQAAVDLIRGGRTYDLILMDKEMPVVDGHEATRQIRSLGVTTPIVALSGDSLESDRDLFLQAGADEFQPKPLTRDKLINIFSRYGLDYD